jgi:hypothetical protein
MVAEERYSQSTLLKNLCFSGSRTAAKWLVVEAEISFVSAHA